MDVEVLYSSDCPGYPAAVAQLQEGLDEAGITAPIRHTRVDSAAAAHQHRFLGSPTVRINGVDIELGADARQDYALACRAYPHPDGQRSAVPPRAWLRRALAQAAP